MHTVHRSAMDSPSSISNPSPTPLLKRFRPRAAIRFVAAIAALLVLGGLLRLQPPGLGSWTSHDLHTLVRSHHIALLRTIFSPDSKSLAIGSISTPFSIHEDGTIQEDGTVSIWDVESGTQEHAFGQEFGNLHLYGSLIPVRFESPTIDVRSADTWNKMRGLGPRTNPIFANPLFVTFNPNGSSIVAGLGEGTLRAWNADTLEPLYSKSASKDGNVGFVHGQFSEDGRRLVTGGSKLLVWDPESGDVLRILGESETGFQATDISKTGRYVLGISFPFNLQVIWRSLSFEPGVHVFNVDSGSEVAQLEGLGTGALSPDENLAALGSFGKREVHLVALPSGETERILQTGQIPYSIQFRPDGDQLAVGGHTVQVWDLWGSEEPPRTLKGHHQNSVIHIKYSPDGRYLASQGTNTIHLWDAKTGRLRWSVGQALVSATAASPIGGLVASSRAGGFVEVFNSTTGMRLASAGPSGDEHECLVFTQDGRRLGAWSESGGHEWWILDGSTLIEDERPQSQPDACESTSQGSYSVTTVPDEDDSGGSVVLLHDAENRFIEFAITQGMSEVQLLSARGVADFLLGRFRLLGVDTSGSLVIREVAPKFPLLLLELLLLAAVVTRQVLRIYRERVRALEITEPMFETAGSFLNHAGAQFRRLDRKLIRIEKAPGMLGGRLPALAVLSGDGERMHEDLDTLRDELKRDKDVLNRKGRSGAAAFLVYREYPDAMARLRMAALRIHDGVSPVPIPFNEVEEAARDRLRSRSLLDGYCQRYLSNPDLFDERNAVSDALSFFGRSDLLTRIADSLAGKRSVGVFGLRKSGKTSLILQLRHAMRRHPVVHIDLQTEGQGARFGTELMNVCLKRFADLAESREVDASGPLPERSLAAEVATTFGSRLVALAANLEKAGYKMPMMLFLDEVDYVLPMKGDDDARATEYSAFFGALRGLCQQQRLLSLLVADVHPDCNRVNHWPGLSARPNPMFNFFQEFFTAPLGEEDTRTMLGDIGGLMGREFDEPTLAEIHALSGGHPFVSRQLASLVCGRAAGEDKCVADSGAEMIRFDRSEAILRRALQLSGTLKSYCEGSIWDDLIRHDAVVEQRVLEALAREECDGTGMADAELRAILPETPENELVDALLWLASVGLIHSRETGGGQAHRLGIGLLGRWLQMAMVHTDVRRA